MKEINGIIYYSTGDVGCFLGVSLQTIKLYERYSRQHIQEGKGPLIPEPHLVLNGRRLYTKDQVKAIRDFYNSLKKGQLSTYTKRRYKKNR